MNDDSPAVLTHGPDDPDDDAAVSDHLRRVRSRLDRVTVDDLDAELAAGALLVDTRPVGLRERDGNLPGALVVDRNQLEWRLDPTSPHRLRDVDTDGAGTRVILVCDEGYASSLGAGSLRDVGVVRATDLVGGFQAWRARRDATA